MFSANENLALRQHKKRVVDYVEACIPEEALDMGTMVMAMQVSCKAPGCVPLETAIVIVFPKLGTDEELIPGLAESKGGNYKTKVLKPMSEVTQDDIFEALPPEFPGGRRSIEKLCIQARDVMLGQITQLFADDDRKGRTLMAEYLQQCLKEYTERDCTPPEWGEPFVPLEGEAGGSPLASAHNKQGGATNSVKPTADPHEQQKTAPGVAKTGNFVFKRPVDEDTPLSPGTTRNTTTLWQTKATAPSHYSAPTNNTTDTKPKSSSQSIMAQLGERQHAPGIRRPGCPCCDPDSAENLIDEMLGL